MNYKCKRCGYECVQRNDLRKHLNRKKLCKPKLEDINIDTLRNELDTKVLNSKPYVNVSVNTFSCENKSFITKNDTNLKIKGTYVCKYCSLEFSTRQSKYRHELKFCSIKKKNEENEENEVAKLKDQIAQKEAEMEAEMALVKEQKEAEIAKKEAEIAKKEAEMAFIINHTKEEMEKQKEFLMNHIEILMKKAGNITNNIDNTNNSITNNIDNKQINIHINGFGKEDLSYITDRHFREWFNGPFSAIPNLVEYIHFNPKKPQNWNAKIQDDKTSKALIYNAEKEMWVKREKKEVINDMVEKSYNILDNNFEMQKEAKTLDEKGKRKFENFMKIYDKGSKELDKRYETEIREKLLNFKEYHINK